MTKGLPGSGKSYWAKERVITSNGTIKRCNKDDLRAMVDCGQWSRENESMIIQIRNMIVAQALRGKKSIIVDDTNFGQHEKILREIADHYGAEFEIKDFTAVPLEVCLERDLKRENSVGKDVIMKMYDKYLKPEPLEYRHVEGKHPAIICDIDGTLAVMGDRSPYDWHRVGIDTVNHAVKSIIDNRADECFLIMVSGRDEVCRKETQEWLRDNKIVCDYLFMRPEGNNEKDNIIKERIFRNDIDPKWNVLYVLDDRDKVVKMWRSLGLTCLQVAEGNF